VPRGWWRGGGAERRQGRQLSCEAVSQEGGWTAEGLVRQIADQCVAYGAGGDVSLQPRGDAGSQVGRVAGREEQSGVVAVEVGEEVGCLLDERGGPASGLRDGGERLLAGRRLLLRRLRCRVGRPRGLSVGVRVTSRLVTSRLVTGDRPSDDPPVGDSLAFPPQVAVVFQFTQGGGDTGGALGEATGEGLDVDLGAPGEGLEVDAEPDREEGEFRVLGEVVADHREALGVADVVVEETAAGVGPSPVRGFVGDRTGLGVRGRARVLGVHQEAPNFLGGQALALGLPSRRGPSHVCGCVALSVGQARGCESSRVGDVHSRG
jgi:hypothetical protein